MEQVIYGDVLFAVNFTMDALALWASGRIAGVRARPARLCAAAAVGALYATATPFAGLGGGAGAAVNVATAAVMCAAAYGLRSPAALARRTALFYAVAAALGGAMTLLYRALGAATGTHIASGAAGISAATPLSVFAVSAAAVWGASFVGGRIFARRRGRRRAVLEIEVAGTRARMEAVCDSGDLARDPLGGGAVIFVARRRLRTLLPPEAARAVLASDPAAAAGLDERWAARTRVIPLETLNGRTLAVGFLPDSVTVDGEGRQACVVCLDAPLPDGAEAVVPSSII